MWLGTTSRDQTATRGTASPAVSAPAGQRFREEAEQAEDPQTGRQRGEESDEREQHEVRQPHFASFEYVFRCRIPVERSSPRGTRLHATGPSRRVEAPRGHFSGSAAGAEERLDERLVVELASLRQPWGLIGAAGDTKFV